MHNPLSRALVIALAVVAFATVAFSQPAPADQSNPIQIVYTGKLLGYFRDTTNQSGAPVSDKANPCPSGVRSNAAKEFLNLRDNPENRKLILLGTGDNFAPQLEARIFDPLPPTVGAVNGTYRGANKEFYFSDGTNWFPNEQLDSMPALKKLFSAGNGTIATDNVGCFLSAARFAAIVPGKHDFYFGAERVRMLARFMAGLHQNGYEPVQMLGANLVIKTTSLEAPPPQPDRDKSKWPDDYSVLTLREGRSIYPWFSSLVRVKINGPKNFKLKEVFDAWVATNGTKSPTADFQSFAQAKSIDRSLTPEVQKDFQKLLSQIDLTKVQICEPDDANEIIRSQCQALNWKATLKDTVKVADDSVTYSFAILPGPQSVFGKDHHVSIFQPGKNYGFCLIDPAAKDTIERQCVLFPVFTPFFTFPRAVASLPQAQQNYTDPDPFVVVQSAAGKVPDVAIFGVVDRSISEQVGVLNFSWVNNGDKLKTVVSAEDPGEALREQVEYFDSWYEDKYKTPFNGMKVLLAQMNPERARVLAARLGYFQVVISEADEEQSTSDTAISTVWSAKTPAGAFVGVPMPYYDSQALKEKREGTIHLGVVEALPNESKTAWQMETRARDSFKIAEVDGKAAVFWTRVNQALPDCLPRGFTLPANPNAPAAPPPDWENLKWLTLCAIRRHTGADVALIQKRDIFTRVPSQAGPDLQQLLDRIMWKGDLLTLLYVPGSALKKALDQSKKYDDEDANPLSIADERLRGLEMLGVKKGGKNYIINEQPLDEKKIYTVATSDYIGAGDTGYPDFQSAALRQKTRPDQYPNKLVPISSVVCRALYPDHPEAWCVADIPTVSYLDDTNAEPLPSYVRPGFGSKLWELFPFKLDAATEPPKTTGAALQDKIQKRPIWMFSLKNLSLSFTGLDNNLTDAEITKKFGAVRTSGVTAKHAQSIGTNLDLRLTRSSHNGGPFLATTVDYKRQSTGDILPRISQINNRVTGEAGYIRNLWGGRSEKSMGMSLSLYSETQLQKPFSTFTLGSNDLLKITQDRSLMLLPRAGLFWRNGTNIFTGGLQGGKELRAFAGYRFETANGTFLCVPQVAQTLADCIKNLSSGPTPQVTINTTVSAILDNRPRAGFYWKSGFSIPFGTKVKYEFSDTGDFFFNFSKDNATDTKYRDESKHSLKFVIWPSLSIGPTLRLLLYKNKVNNDFLFQKEFGFETSFAFDLFNRREKDVQIKHKP